ncbi:MAG: tRNA lysidine(34) synthetase TilS [Thermoleophilia bacterium]|nr:tRNA lysidine(34) synthetase TilS [Thermoleophilia bacterium]
MGSTDRDRDGALITREARVSMRSRPTAVRRVRRLLDDAGVSLARRRVLALCSGGADSVALVSLLAELPRGAAPARIDVLWLDHALRPDVDDERDAARAAADSVGAAFHERRSHRDLAADAAGTEAAARAWRYEQAAGVARTLGCDVVCTGHTASDQLEQAVLALAGVTGRPGDVDAMPVARELPGPPTIGDDDELLLVRPLLSLDRADVEQHCIERSLAWADDPTNLDADAHARFTRATSGGDARVASRDDVGALVDELGHQDYLVIDLDPERSYRVNHVAAPVFDPDGRVSVLLALIGFRGPVTGAEVASFAERLVEGATAVTQSVHGRLPAA